MKVLEAIDTIKNSIVELDLSYLTIDTYKSCNILATILAKAPNLQSVKLLYQKGQIKIRIDRVKCR